MHIHNNSYIQINPLLYFINDKDKIEWIFERYVNILMYGGIVDYIDNVNYSGLFLHVRSYELIELGEFHEIMKSSVLQDRFAVLWVDEYFISKSYRFDKYHFVHPLIVYDYDEETKSYNVIFFDIMKGQVFIKIATEELITAVFGVKEYYMKGGNTSALTKTLSVFRPYSCLKGKYHIDVFIKNLSNYLYCTSDAGAEWYNLQRKELLNSHNVVYGVQIYRALINELRSSECKLNYKSLHDFIKHKINLYERFLYIIQEYEVSSYLKNLIEEFGRHADKLERIRLLNIKYQIKSGNLPASLSFDPDYLSIALKVLEKGYETELEILPLILRELKTLKYTKRFIKENQMISHDVSITNYTDGGFIKKIIFDTPVFSNRIDIMSEDSQSCYEYEEVVINGEYRYLIKRNLEQYSNIYSIDIPVMQIRMIECISSSPVNYVLNVICLPGQDVSKPTFDPNFLKECDGMNQMELKKGENNNNVFSFLGGDPYIFKTGFAINALIYKYVYIEMKVTGTSKKAQLFFSVVGSDIWSAKRLVEFEIIPDGELHIYTIDMTRNEQWHGFIGGIRLDPAHYDSHCIWKAEDNAECCIKRFVFKSNTAE